MDITHHGVYHFLTITDCGPSQFSVWRQLAQQDSASVIRQLEEVFFERGPPRELLTDNDTAFRSKEFRTFADAWGVSLRFCCAYAPAGNGIAERCHRTVKRIAARMHCSIQEAVYWHNVTPKDDDSHLTAPANAIYRYEVRVKGVDVMPPLSGPEHSPYQVGDCVWVKAPESRCTTKFGRGRVTEIISPQSVLVDGMPRHMKDLRPRYSLLSSEEDSDSTTSSESRSESLIRDDETETESDDLPEAEVEAHISEEAPRLRRSTRKKRPPPGCRLCDHEIREECGDGVERRRDKRLRLACARCKEVVAARGSEPGAV